MNFKKIVKKLIPRGLFAIIEPYFHLAVSIIANIIYGFPARNMEVIGVTGTAGKTTTTTLMASVLRASGKKTAYFTTVEHDYGKGPVFNDTRMTTVGALPLVKMFKQAKNNGVGTVVLEVSSHALAQHRVWGINFKAAIITNITHEHLDYHKTFEAYLEAKQRLFKLAGKSGGVGVVNADDPSADNFLGLAARTVTYGIGKADVRATSVKTGPEGSTFVVQGNLGDRFEVKTKLPGSFNVSNVLAVCAAGLALGIEPEAIAKGVFGLSAVNGRMASYKASSGFSAIIDFAHTPSSFEKIFKDIRPVTKGKLIAVFGCAGERDVGRRYIQGELAANYCDVIILTEDDPRSEDNKVIMSQIKEGIAKSSKKPEVMAIDLREEAIDKAVQIAGAGDVILLLSKGHERSIALAGGKLKPWNEETALKNACQKHGIKLA